MKERITARIVLLNKENKFLLLQCNNGKEIFWLPPGGGVEQGETFFQAAQRELFEETGIQNAIIEPTHRWYAEEVRMVVDNYILFKEHIFLAQVDNPAINFDNHTEDERREMIDCHWWDVNQFDQQTHTLYPSMLVKLLGEYFSDNK